MRSQEHNVITSKFEWRSESEKLRELEFGFSFKFVDFFQSALSSRMDFTIGYCESFSCFLFLGHG